MTHAPTLGGESGVLAPRDAPQSDLREASGVCGCIKCIDSRVEQMRADGVPVHLTFQGPAIPGWRYGCETCGNKRCPHHSDHTLTCTRSNEPGQTGSVFT